MKKDAKEKKPPKEKKSGRRSPQPFEGLAVPPEYIADLEAHIALPHHQKVEMMGDFDRAIRLYLDMGLSMEEAMTRLSPARLGGFYAHAASAWYPLDTAAKIYPLSMKQGQMPMFRLSVYLKEDVRPEIFQMALTFIIKRFPSFATTVKRGVFWHYLDSAKRRYVVEPERELPCAPLRIAQSGSQSFRALYFRNRISVEFFHGLTDGSGGLTFLKTLTAEYLGLLGYEIPAEEGVWDPDATPNQAEWEDAFLRAVRERGPEDEKIENPEDRRGAGFMGKSAAQMSGRLTRVKPNQVIHFEIDAGKLKEAARARDATVTELMVALMLMANKYATEAPEGDLQIQVPVNMRKFDGSATVRNYSMYLSVIMAPGQVTGLEETLAEVSRQVRLKSTQGAMRDMMKTAVKLTRSLRFIPLAVKAPVARFIYGFLGDSLFSNTLSNLGVVRLPREMEPYVEKFDFVLGTAKVARASCSMATYQNAAVFSIVKLTKDPSFEEKMRDLLTSLGLVPRVTGSEPYES